MPAKPFTPFLAALSLALPLALAGCSSGADEMLGVVVIGAQGDPFVTTGSLPPAAQVVRAATAEGLVGLDEQGRVVPALAERWIVYDDGLSYIFRLRDGVWPDGSAIDAPDVAGRWPPRADPRPGPGWKTCAASSCGPGGWWKCSLPGPIPISCDRSPSRNSPCCTRGAAPGRCS